MGLVAEGLGVALIPDLILRTVHHDDVVALPITPASRRTITAVTTSDLQRVPAVQATLDALIESAGSQSTAPTTRMPEPAFSI
jgi:DNA-binding transcriptional LysR family regulator